MLVLEDLIGLHRTVQLQTSASSKLVVGADLDYCDAEWFALEMNWDYSVMFEIAPTTAFQTLADFEGYSISSKGFLPTVLDLMIIWIKYAHSHPF